jgi:FMN phosphatase YigB (HAD superfamily)
MTWWSSLREKCVRAETTWLRLHANREISAFEVMEATDVLPEPEWEEVLQGLKFYDLIEIAFKKYLITNLDHPIVKRLRGRV